MDKLSNLIIGKLTQEQLKKVITTLGAKYYSSFRGKSLDKCNSIRTNDISEYMTGDYDKYVFYCKHSTTGYKGSKIVTFEEFEELAGIKHYFTPTPIEKVREIFKTTPEADIIIPIYKNKLIQAYQYSGEELKKVFQTLFGKDLFEAKTYKVGDKFIYSSDVFVLAKINTTVITMLNTGNYSNFTSSKSVLDINKITERELKDLLGIYYDQFKEHFCTLKEFRKIKFDRLNEI